MVNRRLRENDIIISIKMENDLHSTSNEKIIINEHEGFAQALKGYFDMHEPFFFQ